MIGGGFKSMAQVYNDKSWWWTIVLLFEVSYWETKTFVVLIIREKLHDILLNLVVLYWLIRTSRDFDFLAKKGWEIVKNGKNSPLANILDQKT